MILGNLKIYNYGQSYLLHISDQAGIVVNKAYVYNNNGLDTTNADLLFKNFVNNTYVIRNLMVFIAKKLKLNFVFNLFLSK